MKKIQDVAELIAPFANLRISNHINSTSEEGRLVLYDNSQTNIVGVASVVTETVEMDRCLGETKGDENDEILRQTFDDDNGGCDAGSLDQQYKVLPLTTRSASLLETKEDDHDVEMGTPDDILVEQPCDSVEVQLSRQAGISKVARKIDVCNKKPNKGDSSGETSNRGVLSATATDLKEKLFVYHSRVHNLREETSRFLEQHNEKTVSQRSLVTVPTLIVDYAGAVRNGHGQVPQRSRDVNATTHKPISTRTRTQSTRGLDDLELSVKKIFQEELGPQAWAKRSTPSPAEKVEAATKCHTDVRGGARSAGQGSTSDTKRRATHPRKPNSSRAPPRVIPTTHDICIVLDTVSTMKRFLTPLLSNFDKFSDLVLGATEQELRMSLLTPNEMFDFTAEKNEFLKHFTAVKELMGDDMDAACGLDQALSQLEKLSWDKHSTRYVYLFTNLSTQNCEDASEKTKFLGDLCRMTRPLPMTTEVMVGCWLDDNDLLIQAFRHQNRSFRSFKLLDLRQMVACIVDDRNLVGALLSSLVVAREMTHVRISRKLQGPNPTGRFSKVSEKTVKCRAKMFQVKPLSSIQDVLTIDKIEIHSRVCWLSRQEKPYHVSGNRVFTSGILEGEKGEWKENVVLKSCKLDVLNASMSEKSESACRRQALVAAVARYLAVRYNKEQRPEHCVKIHFLNGYVVKGPLEHCQPRVFYAERALKSTQGGAKMSTFCYTTGKWNENKVDESLLRFALACFKLSGGDIMLAGFQGWRDGDAYVLTGPSVLSRTCRIAHTGDCTNEYMKGYRQETKALMEKNGWDQKVALNSNGDKKGAQIKRKGPKSSFFGF